MCIDSERVYVRERGGTFLLFPLQPLQPPGVQALVLFHADGAQVTLQTMAL